MDLAIVIVSFNTRELTRNCLGSVYQALAASRYAAQVWVVDNASTDGSAVMVRERFSQATLLASEDNLGFAGGVNLALQAVLRAPDAPRHILLLNPDTLVAPDALDLMVGFLDEHPRAGVAGAQLSYADGSFQHGAFHFPTLAMAFFDFWTIHHRLLHSRLNGRYPRRWYRAGRPFRIDHPLGAAMMIRRTALEQVGLLDTRYFMYCEEIDWCLRARALGWACYCVPSARVVHLEGQSAKQFREAMFVALWRSRYRLFAKHYGRCYRRAVRAIVRAGLQQAIRQAQQAVERGELGADEGERRIAAYRTVMEM